MNGRIGTLATSVQAVYSEESSSGMGFDEVFTLHHRAVFRTARAYVRDSAIAEDITQEVFLRFYRNMEKAPGDDLLRAWLLRVTINLSLNCIRGHNRSSNREEQYMKQVSEREFAPAPNEDFERKVEIQQARIALDKIKEPMRSCLLLKQQGLSYREISQALSINETSVGSYVARGRKEFVRHYGKIGASK